MEGMKFTTPVIEFIVIGIEEPIKFVAV